MLSPVPRRPVRLAGESLSPIQLSGGVGRAGVVAANLPGAGLFQTIAEFFKSGIIARNRGIASVARGGGDGAARLERAIDALRECIATAAGIPLEEIGRDDDLIDDLALDEIERESLGLVIEEIFAIQLAETIWRSPLYRSPASLAEWAIRQSDEAAWIEARRSSCQRKAG
jgi:hypothetical protein